MPPLKFISFVKHSLTRTQDHLKEETFPESELENEVYYKVMCL